MQLLFVQKIFRLSCRKDRVIAVLSLLRGIWAAVTLIAVFAVWGLWLTFSKVKILGGLCASCGFSTFGNASIAHTHFHDSALSHVTFQKARLTSCNTIDCTLDSLNYLAAVLDGSLLAGLLHPTSDI